MTCQPLRRLRCAAVAAHRATTPRNTTITTLHYNTYNTFITLTAVKQGELITTTTMTEQVLM
eukprot:scaffold8601_cov180-Ochromonas_danica.AAC.6